MKLYLASISKTREDIMEKIGVNFEVIPSDVEEATTLILMKNI